jgi:hypothetical protein
MLRALFFMMRVRTTRPCKRSLPAVARTFDCRRSLLFGLTYHDRRMWHRCHEVSSEPAAVTRRAGSSALATPVERSSRRNRRS